MTVVELLLMISGDVETNPGPVRPGLLKSLLDLLRPVQEKYKSLGEQLKVSEDVIQSFTEMYNGDTERIFIEMINKWLQIYEEDYAEVLEADKVCCIYPFSKKEYISILSRALTEIGEAEVAESLEKEYQSQMRLYQCLLGDLDSVKEKYVNIGVELEVDMSEISMLEAKYADNQSTIFASMLLIWMDSCSSKNYIKEICNALAAVNEPSLTEMIMDKYQAWRVGSLQQPSQSLSISSHGDVVQDSVDAGVTQHSLSSCCYQGPPVKRTVEADLLIYLPPSLSNPDTFEKLDCLAETMKDTGDSKFPLVFKNNGTNIYCNTPWKLIIWHILHPENSSSEPYVKGSIKIYFRLDYYDQFIHIFKTGVTAYLKKVVPTYHVFVVDATAKHS